MKRNSNQQCSDILLVSTADWDNPYWTNKQHVTVQLAELGYRVIYVESQGLRRPTATVRDAKRIINRIKKFFKFARPVRPNVWVHSPIVVPFHGVPGIALVNKVLLNLGLFLARKIAGLRPTLLWTYSPLTTRLYDIDIFEKVVYHAVDDIAAQPGMPAMAIESSEQDLVRRATVVFTTAHKLQEKHVRSNPRTFYFSNVADFSHFNRALTENLEMPSELENIPGPILGFVGAISGYKLDFKLISNLAEKRPNYSIVLVGEVGEGDPHTNVSDLEKHKNIYFLGGKPYSRLPNFIRHFSVALLPSAINEYTKSMFPMKFFEYLAAGKPIVSTKLPALRGFESISYFSESVEDFVGLVDVALSEDGALLERRLEVARAQTYEARTKKMIELIKSIQ